LARQLHERDRQQGQIASNKHVYVIEEDEPVPQRNRRVIRTYASEPDDDMFVF